MTMAPSLLTLPWAGTGVRPRFSAAAIFMIIVSMLTTEVCFLRHLALVHRRADSDHTNFTLLQMLGGRNMALVCMAAPSDATTARAVQR